MALCHGKKEIKSAKVAKSVGVTFHLRLSSPALTHLFLVQFCPKNENDAQFHFLLNQNILRILQGMGCDRLLRRTHAPRTSTRVRTLIL